jgi:predicted dehydrogenase
MANRISVGLVGVGSMGRNHLKVLSGLSDLFQVIGYVDPKVSFTEIEPLLPGIQRFSEVETLISSVDGVMVTGATAMHGPVLEATLAKEKWAFVEKPALASMSELAALKLRFPKAWGAVMVGQIERFNPVAQAMQQQAAQYRNLAFTRHAPFTSRGADVSVVMDLMIHDIDLLLSMWEGTPRILGVSAAGGVGVGADAVVAALGFADGRMATLSASRIAPGRIRTIAASGSKVSALGDLAQGSLTIAETTSNQTLIHEIRPEPINALREELIHWADTIHRNYPAQTALSQVSKSLTLAWEIENLCT